MAYTALYRTFRPKTFSEVVGQEHIKTTLKNQIKAGRVGHAYLLNGTRGTGKTTIAKILARAVNCENLQDGEPCNECEICKAILEGSLTDVVEMDAASNNSVEDIREIRNEVNFLPTRAKYRVYIIDEVHMLSTGAFNALLKTLEEPPEHVKFILATTEPQKLPATILSRCQRFDFKKISDEDIEKRLEFVCKENHVKINDEALKLIAVLSEGAMRDALSILERCIQDGEDNINVNKIKDLVGIPKFISVHNINDRKDLINLLWEMIKYTKDILISKIGKKLEVYSKDELKKIDELSNMVSKEKLLNIIFKLSEMENKLKQSSQKTIIFETGIINLCVNNSLDLEKRVEKLEETLENNFKNSNNGQRVEDNIQIKEKVIPVEEKKDNNKAVKEENKIKKNEQKIEKEEYTQNLKSEDFWSDVLSKLKSNGKLMLYANLLNTRAVELNDMTIGIEFPGGLNEFRKKLLEQSENFREIQKLVSIACGREMQIKFIDKSGESKITKQKIQKEKQKKTGDNNVNSLDDLADLGLPINYIDE